jgi:hypothetical protein
MDVAPYIGSKLATLLVELTFFWFERYSSTLFEVSSYPHHIGFVFCDKTCPFYTCHSFEQGDFPRELLSSSSIEHGD